MICRALTTNPKCNFSLNSHSVILGIFLQYLYESNLPPIKVFATEDSCSLMMLASKYNVLALKEACRFILLKDPQACDLVQLAILGYSCKDEELKNAAISKMGEDMGPLRKLEGWAKLEGYPALALEIADQMKK